MSYGLTACLLLRLDARMGSWVALADLSTQLAVPVAALLPHCERLLADQLLSVQREGCDGPITHARIDRASLRPELHLAGDYP